jgi:hypothetical protein
VQQVDKFFVCRIIKKQIIYTMIHAFMLVVLLGDAPLNIGAPMYFRKCYCPSRYSTCKHLKIFKSWESDNYSIGSVYNDQAKKVGELF